MSVTRALCEHCGEYVATRAMKRHVKVCVKRPDDDKLREMYETSSAEGIARELEVSPAVVSKWLRAAGISKRYNVFTRPPIEVFPEFAPRWGSSCLNCSEEQVAACGARNTWDGGTVACEAPERIDLENGQVFAERPEEANEKVRQELAAI